MQVVSIDPHEAQSNTLLDVMQNMGEQLTVTEVLRQLASEVLSPIDVLMFS